MTSSGYTFDVASAREMSDAEIAEDVALGNVIHAEEMPEDAPYDVAAVIDTLRATPPRIGLWNLRARDRQGELVAATSINKDWQHDENPDVGGIGVAVHPDHRGRGVGSTMLAYQVAFAQALGETRLLISTSDRYPRAAELARALGGEAKSESHVNELPRDEVDADLLRRWVSEAATRSADYDLVAVDGRVPDEIVDDYVILIGVMNDAPRDELVVNDFVLTVARLREYEELADVRRDESWLLIARHRATGRLVGLHSVGWTPTNPKVLYIGLTGVESAHRGAALGKWMKAAMTLRALDERPEWSTIRTANADSNDAMLGINAAMGYRPSISMTTWETTRERVETWLADRHVQVPDVRHLVDAQRPPAGRSSAAAPDGI